MSDLKFIDFDEKMLSDIDDGQAVNPDVIANSYIQVIANGDVPLTITGFQADTNLATIWTHFCRANIKKTNTSLLALSRKSREYLKLAFNGEQKTILSITALTDEGRRWASSLGFLGSNDNRMLREYHGW